MVGVDSHAARQTLRICFGVPADALRVMQARTSTSPLEVSRPSPSSRVAVPFQVVAQRKAKKTQQVRPTPLSTVPRQNLACASGPEAQRLFAATGA